MRNASIDGMLGLMNILSCDNGILDGLISKALSTPTLFGPAQSLLLDAIFDCTVDYRVNNSIHASSCDPD